MQAPSCNSAQKGAINQNQTTQCCRPEQSGRRSVAASRPTRGKRLPFSTGWPPPGRPTRRVSRRSLRRLRKSSARRRRTSAKVSGINGSNSSLAMRMTSSRFQIHARQLTGLLGVFGKRPRRRVLDVVVSGRDNRKRLGCGGAVVHSLHRLRITVEHALAGIAHGRCAAQVCRASPASTRRSTSCSC